MSDDMINDMLGIVIPAKAGGKAEPETKLVTNSVSPFFVSWWSKILQYASDVFRNEVWPDCMTSKAKKLLVCVLQTLIAAVATPRQHVRTLTAAVATPRQHVRTLTAKAEGRKAGKLTLFWGGSASLVLELLRPTPVLACADRAIRIVEVGGKVHHLF